MPPFATPAQRGFLPSPQGPGDGPGYVQDTAEDTTSINALDKVVIKFRQNGAAVELVGLNAQSRAIVERLAIYDKPTTAESASSH